MAATQSVQLVCTRRKFFRLSCSHSDYIAWWGLEGIVFSYRWKPVFFKTKCRTLLTTLDPVLIVTTCQAIGHIRFADTEEHYFSSFLCTAPLRWAAKYENEKMKVYEKSMLWARRKSRPNILKDRAITTMSLLIVLYFRTMYYIN